MAQTLVTVAAVVLSALGTVSAFSNGDAIRILASHIGPVNNRMCMTFCQCAAAPAARCTAVLCDTLGCGAHSTSLLARLQHPKHTNTAFCRIAVPLTAAVARQISLNL